MKYIISPAVVFSLFSTYSLSAETHDPGSVSPLGLFQECEFCPEMIVLPLGNFTLGAPLEESQALGLPVLRSSDAPGGLPEEGPVHAVEIDLPIAMARDEITYDQWMACVEAGGCEHNPDPTVTTRYGGYLAVGNHPVIDVSFIDIQEFVAWLNYLVGAEAYRLPTEAEWEYAARGGADSLYAQGDELTLEHGNFWQSPDGEFLDWRQSPGAPGQLTPIPVSAHETAHPWGLRHLEGNVTEITLSCFTDRHLGIPTSTEHYLEAQSAGPCRRTVRGGSYNRGSAYARPAFRTGASEVFGNQYRGFRVVRILAEEWIQ